VLLVITGKAGIGKTTQSAYRGGFSLSDVITDVYFSNFEQPGVAGPRPMAEHLQGGGLPPNGSAAV